MKQLYLNHAEGIKPPLIRRGISRQSALANFRFFEKGVRGILRTPPKEFVSFSQNITTLIINILLPVLKKDSYEVYICSHEIRWFKTLFKIGRLPSYETTYPNYASQVELAFLKKMVHIFDPEEFLKNPKKIIGSKKSIIIFSHISRMTGEYIAGKNVYDEIKKINFDNIVIVDGAQAVGAIHLKIKSLADVYLGTTSKFINAEPNISFCWIRKKLAKKFNINFENIDSYKFSKEIYSSILSLKKLVINPQKIKKYRKVLSLLLKKKSLFILEAKSQAPHIAIIPWNKLKLDKKVEELRDTGFIVSANTGYSIKEPKIPGIRISLTPQLTFKQLEQFVDCL